MTQKRTMGFPCLPELHPSAMFVIGKRGKDLTMHVTIFAGKDGHMHGQVTIFAGKLSNRRELMSHAQFHFFQNLFKKHFPLYPNRILFPIKRNLFPNKSLKKMKKKRHPNPTPTPSRRLTDTGWMDGKLYLSTVVLSKLQLYLWFTQKPCKIKYLSFMYYNF